MPLLFKWHLKYRDQIEYKVYGGTLKTVELYIATDHLLDYSMSHYNGSKEEFESDVVRRNGGAAVRHRQGEPDNRWTQEEWNEFINFLTLDNKADNEKLAEHRARLEAEGGTKKENFSKYYQAVPLVLPRSIYWDFDTHRWEDEPFYALAQVGP